MQISELINKDVEDCFWQFIVERQNIWYKRFVLKEQWPWTADEALQTVFFTNVYRELDKGTIYLMYNIIDQGSPEQELFEILLYRQFNNRDTYQFLKEQEREFGDFSDWEYWSQVLKIYAEEHTVFTKAHMTNSLTTYGFKNKIDNMCTLLNNNWKSINQTYDMLMNKTKSLQEQHKYVASLDGFGDFLAYEVVTDLTYSKRLLRFDINSWANAGPGCKKAIELLMNGKDILKQHKIDYLEVIRYLWKSQNDSIPKLGLELLKWNDLDLSLRNVEHSLCEFYKYSRYVMEGKARRKYHG